jgi:hypothetical protein
MALSYAPAHAQRHHRSDDRAIRVSDGRRARIRQAYSRDASSQIRAGGGRVGKVHGCMLLAMRDAAHSPALVTPPNRGCYNRDQRARSRCAVEHDICS